MRPRDPIGSDFKTLSATRRLPRSGAKASDVMNVVSEASDFVASRAELKRKLKQRLGHFVPTQATHVPIDEWLVENDEGVVTSVIPLDDAEAIAAVKAYAKANFYDSAPMAKALGLDDHECPRVMDMIDKELDLYIGSGLSFQFHKMVNGENPA